jgi:uncharacterized protein
MSSIGLFTAVLKVAEVCNIDCDYCYYYNMGDDSWRSYPPYMTEDVFTAVCDRFEELLKTRDVSRLFLVFHGGVPLMAGVERLESFIAIARERFAERTNLTFAVQTNGTILSDDWIALFERTGISVGVSIDGPAATHDQHRKTKQGRPTYSLVEQFVRRCTESAGTGRMKGVASITVIDPTKDITSTVQHLQENFSLRSMAFLLPDDCANDILFDDRKADRFGEILIQLYEAMVEDPRIRNKEIAKFLRHAQSDSTNASVPLAQTTSDSIPYVCVTVQSNGVMKITEELIATGRWRKNFPTVDLRSEPIEAFINHEQFRSLQTTYASTPTECSDCRWKNVCRGGSLHERRMSQGGFDGRSVFCHAYIRLYDYMYHDLLHHGFPKEVLDGRLQISSDVAAQPQTIDLL